MGTEESVGGMEEAGGRALLNLGRVSGGDAAMGGVVGGGGGSGGGAGGGAGGGTQEKAVRKDEMETNMKVELKDIAGTTAAMAKKMSKGERDLMLWKRKLRNRESARRSRQRKKQGGSGGSESRHSDEAGKIRTMSSLGKGGHSESTSKLSPIAGKDGRPFEQSDFTQFEPLSSESREQVAVPVLGTSTLATPASHKRGLNLTPVHFTPAHTQSSAEKVDENAGTAEKANVDAQSNGVNAPSGNDTQDIAVVLLKLQAEQENLKQQYEMFKSSLAYLLSQQKNLEDDNHMLKQELAKLRVDERYRS